MLSIVSFNFEKFTFEPSRYNFSCKYSSLYFAHAMRMNIKNIKITARFFFKSYSYLIDVFHLLFKLTLKKKSWNWKGKMKLALMIESCHHQRNRRWGVPARTEPQLWLIDEVKNLQWLGKKAWQECMSDGAFLCLLQGVQQIVSERERERIQHVIKLVNMALTNTDANSEKEHWKCQLQLFRNIYLFFFR